MSLDKLNTSDHRVMDNTIGDMFWMTAHGVTAMPTFDCPECSRPVEASFDFSEKFLMCGSCRRTIRCPRFERPSVEPSVLTGGEPVLVQIIRALLLMGGLASAFFAYLFLAAPSYGDNPTAARIVAGSLTVATILVYRFALRSRRQ